MKKLVFIQRDLSHYRLQFFSEIERQSREFDLESLVLAGSPPARPEIANFRYKVFPKISFQKTLDPPCWIRGMWKSVKGADIVVAMQDIKCLNDPVFWFFRKYLCRHWIWWGHGYNHQLSLDKGMLRTCKEELKNFMAPRADGLLAYTPRGAQYWINRGFSPHKVMAYYNTIEVETFRDIAKEISSSDIEKVKKELGVEEKFILVFSGRLYKQKEVDFLLKSFARIKEKKTDVALLLIGDGPERENLKDLANELGTSDVHFLGEIVDSRAVSLLFHMADLLVVPGLVGLAIVHGFAFGLPMITTKHNFHSPEIEYLSIENGRMTDKKEELFAEEILSLLANPEKLSALRDGAWKTGTSLFLRDSVRRFLQGIVAFSSNGECHKKKIERSTSSILKLGL